MNFVMQMIRKLAIEYTDPRDVPMDRLVQLFKEIKGYRDSVGELGESDIVAVDLLKELAKLRDLRDSMEDLKD